MRYEINETEAERYWWCVPATGAQSDCEFASRAEAVSSVKEYLTQEE